MTKSTDKFEIEQRDQSFTYYTLGEWIFFQRSKESGGGCWLGHTYDSVLMLGIDHPFSLS